MFSCSAIDYVAKGSLAKHVIITNSVSFECRLATVKNNFLTVASMCT